MGRKHSQSRSAQASLKKTLVLSLSDLVLTDASAWSPGFRFPVKPSMPVPFISPGNSNSLFTKQLPPHSCQPLNKTCNLAKCFLHQAVFSNTSVTNGSRTDQISYVCFQILEIFSKSCLFFPPFQTHHQPPDNFGQACQEAGFIVWLLQKAGHAELGGGEGGCW